MSSMTGFRGPTGLSQGFATGRDVIPKGYKAGQIQQFTPEQMNLFRSQFQHLMPQGFLSRLAGGDEDFFQQVEGPALRQFSGLQGQLASRFSGMGGRGSLGARHSSGFQNAATAGAANFAEQMQAQRLGLQQQAVRDLFDLSHSLLSERPQQRILVPKQKSFLQQLLLSGIEGFGQGVGGSSSGGIFSGIKSLFGG